MFGEKVFEDYGKEDLCLDNGERKIFISTKNKVNRLNGHVIAVVM